MAVFALTLVHGASWDGDRPRREQAQWDEHAQFMDALVADGFVVLGGPIGDGSDVLLIVDAADDAEVRTRLAPDPWLVAGILAIDSLRPWQIWLDGRNRLGQG